jgi:hypothetical protein
MGVLIADGAIALTVIWWTPSSNADAHLEHFFQTKGRDNSPAACVRPRTANLDAE